MIKFWKTSDPWGEFSNFYLAEIVVCGIKWPSTEHYFQAQKTFDLNRRTEIQSKKRARDAASLGRKRDIPIRSDWDEIKDSIMLTALRAKFFQHPKLGELLLSTGEVNLVEDSPVDSYWGIGKGDGKNRLGELLQQVRGELKDV